MNSGDPSSLPHSHPRVPFFHPDNLTREEREEEEKRLAMRSPPCKTEYFRSNGLVQMYEENSNIRIPIFFGHCRYCVYCSWTKIYTCDPSRHSGSLYPPLPNYEATIAGWIEKV